MGSLIVFVGLILMAVGIIGVIRPMKRLYVPTRGRAVLAVILGLVILSAGAVRDREANQMARHSAQAVGTSGTSAPSDLVLISSREYESASAGFHYVEGQVKNVADTPFRDVMAVVTWTDNEGNAVRSDTAVIHFNPILPGQTSAFKTVSRSDPAMSGYSVAFKTRSGDILEVADQRTR